MNVPGVLGGLAGGAVGAAVWVAVAFTTGDELGFVAIGVGVAVGAGVHLASAGRSHAWNGSFAAVLTLCALLAGHVGAGLCTGTAQVLAGDCDESAADDEFAISFVADCVAAERCEAGQVVVWPAGSVPGFAARATDYPPDIWDKAAARWCSWSIEQRSDFRAVLPGNPGGVAALRGKGEQRGPFGGLELLDAVFAALAVGCAFKLGTTAGVHA